VGSSQSGEKTLVIISGPTASGKTSFSITLAQHFHTEIISADSRQIYKELSVGVAIPSIDELSAVKHHFIHSHSILKPLNAYDYATQALKLTEELFRKCDVLIMAGGSGLFLKAVYDGIDVFPDPSNELRNFLNELKVSDYSRMLEMLRDADSQTWERIDRNNPARVQRALEVCLTTGKKYSDLLGKIKRKHEFRIRKFAIMPPMSVLDQNIDKRLRSMRENGLTEEAKALYPHRHETALKTIGYRELFDFFDGKFTEDQAYEKIRVNTRRYARRQNTWLRKRKGFCVSFTC
jgi:tRNA dimethylallyltransferase